MSIRLVFAMVTFGYLLANAPLKADEKTSRLHAASPNDEPISEALLFKTHFIEAHCTDCHSGKEPSGGLDLEMLGGDLHNRDTARRWIMIHDRIVAGEMPPANETQPSPSENKSFIRDLSRALHQAEDNRRQVVLRRLNRREYENTVGDLFQTDVKVNGLIEDSSTDGFDTVGEGLAVSPEAMQAYLETADQVLDAVFGTPEKPKRIHHQTNLLQQVDWKGRPQLDSQIGKMFRRTDDGLVIFQSNYCPTNLVNFARLRVPAGTYRGTIRARAIQSDKPVTLRIYGGDTIVNRGEQHLVGYYDIPPGEWTTIQFTDRLVEDGGTFLPKCYGTRDTRTDADTYPEPGIELGDILIEGPVDPWPPISRTRLLGNLNTEMATVEDAELILSRLLPRAFRRPVQSGEAEEYIKLFESASAEGRPFESALRVALKAILCSPEFLFLDEPVSRREDDHATTKESKGLQKVQPESDASTDQRLISQHALAARLSYFLWSSMPDQELSRLANEGRLRDAKVLHEQVERLLRSPKSVEFTRNFTGQWLDLRDIDFTEPDANLYPEFDELLRISMVRETEMFFDHVLKNNSNVTKFVDADFSFLNERLARHYGVDGVEGQHFRRVELPANGLRGGLLTQASILKVTANGTYTSPVLRGTWILENILGMPTFPPPDNVGSVEPDIRGATTIREQLAKHRDAESCSFCHARIDPPGFALECFDPIGGFRTHYRTMSQDAERPDIKQAPFTHAWVRYRIGQPVDSTSRLPDGSECVDVRDFKKHLVSDPAQLTRNLTRKLLTYSLGRRVGFTDRPVIEDIVDQVREENYGFRSLVHALIQSPAFQHP